MIGRYSFFEKVLAFFVMLMGITFIISMFVVWPSPAILKQAVLPSVPDEPGAGPGEKFTGPVVPPAN